jgi:hypothetical protein
LKNSLLAALGFVYFVGDIATFGKLTFLDCYVYTWWNWLIAVPINFFLATIWPLYWAILRPIFGSGC